MAAMHRNLEPAPAPFPAICEPMPFLKWAGGKSQLLAELDPLFPRQFDRYLEPFLGGGAVFFHLRARFPEAACVLCDNNPELINCYEAVRDAPDELMERLDQHAARFEQHPAAYYYSIRGQGNLAGKMERAARMIFLNKTCFNGLWRVNGRGEFNVPLGSNRTVKPYDRVNLWAASRALQGTQLVVQDFQQTLAPARAGDFVYLDPPYHPVSKTAAFTAYTREAFGPEQQRRLAELFAAAAQRGARLLLSNSSTRLVLELYAAFEIRSVQARRSINAQGNGRGAVTEVVVLG